MENGVQKLLVLGAGESGVGTALLAKKLGMEVRVSDSKIPKPKYTQELKEANIDFEIGGHTPWALDWATIAVKSPGIPPSASPIVNLTSRGILPEGEIEFAWKYAPKVPIIAITGTNGKTTTTALTHYILNQAGLNVGLGGNIGRSFARLLAEDEPYDYYVLELSSFQLDDIDTFRPYISMLLNITPDHLDRYGNIENYAHSKMGVAKNAGPDQYFIYNADDEEVANLVQKLQIEKGVQALPFSQTSTHLPGAYISENLLHISLSANPDFTMKTDEFALPGKHNRSNTMAAAIAAQILHVRKDVIRESLRSFQNVEHRLEFVAKVNGVDYINDSKATNVNAAWYALESMTSRVIWIAGGVDKGNNYTDLKPLVRDRVKAMICLGKSNERLHEAFNDDLTYIVDALSMSEAISKAVAVATSGDVILLAPACASFDLFENYEDRGKQFKDAVRALQLK